MAPAATVVVVAVAAAPIGIDHLGWIRQCHGLLTFRSPLAFISMSNQPVKTDLNSRQPDFERVLSREPFKGLKAILDNLAPNREALCDAVGSAHSYEELLAKLGYKITLIKQIHVQDAYSRMGEAGGIKSVLQFHDTSTHSSFPTLVNFDSTVTVTPKSSAFFNEMLAALKTQLRPQN